jgi:hypothetical protein
LFNKNIRDEKESDRKERETGRRRGREKELETGFGAVIKSAEKVIAPVKSLLQKIIDFILAVFIGRSLVLLLRWFKDPDNKKKVEAISRFLGDHWPKLLALFLTFGTSFGRFALGLTKAVAKGAVKLGFAIAKLLAAKKVKGAMGVARFLGGGKAKLAAGVLGTGAALGGAYAVTQGLKGGGDEKESSGAEKESSQPVQKLSGGGKVSVPAFSGGGLNLSNMMKGASMGAMFGPLGMLLGGALGSGKPQQMASGFVKGPGGPKDDKVPAMLSDGEFVMSAGAVQKYGVDTLESMNAAGGGTNKPKVVSGTTYASGGGYMGDKPTFGPRATPQMSSQEDMNRAANKIRLEDRIKRIENQIQVNLALSQGKGVNIRGATPGGAQLGTGYKTIHQGREAVVIKGGAKNFSTGIGDREITLGGKRYYAQKRGDDVIYVVRDTRNLQSPGLFDPGGMFGGPRNSARMDYAASKGKYYSSSDQKTYGNYNDAVAAKKSRMTSLESQQRLIRLSGQGGTGGKTGIRYDTEMEEFKKEQDKRGGILGGIGRGFTRMFGTGEQIERIDAEDKASQARIKQRGAESIGRYYSSSDGKYYANYAAAEKARLVREQRLKSGIKPLPEATLKPGIKPLPEATLKPPASTGTSGGGGTSSSTAKLSTQNKSSKGQARLAKRQNALKSSGITPPSKPTLKVTTPKKANKRGAHMGMNKGTSSGPTVPNFSASSGSRSRRRTAATYGIG